MAVTRRWKFPCGHCSNPVKSNQQGVFCECCQLWYHCKCLEISGKEYSYLQASNSGWCCPYCFHSALPFADSSRLSSASAPVSTLSVSDNSLSSAATLAPPPSTGISLYLANSRSLIPKMDDLRLLVSGSSPPSIIALTETWLDSSIRDCEVSSPCSFIPPSVFFLLSVTVSQSCFLFSLM